MLHDVIRCIIFDLDGTLVHSLPGIAASLNRTLDAAGLYTHPESDVRGFIGNGIGKLVERAAPTVSDDELDTLVDGMRDNYARTWKDGTHPYAGVTETLANLSDRNIHIAVLSNKPDEYCRKITDYLFPDIHFPIVRGQLINVPSKPDPSGALSICSELNIAPENTALVGDSTIDLKTAKNAGMIAVAATWGYHDPPALAALSPDHTINKMNDLISALKI
ncbi:MAG TPA: HAD family hydrolase [Verrucomicrobiales bacterium]|nr:HAD family hydrolase [Verrucomicrobiales bacterium]